MIGQQFGHYDVVSRLGSGGMGVVYLARDTRLDRRVAIKVLPDGRVADERARTRFRREAQALSRLNHPNIATIYDFDQNDGRDFLVMEYIEGESLRDVGPDALPPAEVVRLGTQLAEALAAAHGAGVVHLDLKPGNLMRTPDGRLKILDFGIARLHALDPLEETTHTRTIGDTTGTAANSAGTPPYMAPEQVAAGPVDGRTDIYGAGATLYELATGRRLFTEPRGAALYDSILRMKPDPPSGLNQSIDAPLESTLLKALEKSPLKRQQDAKELLADLQRCTTVSGTPVARPHRRRRRELMLTAAALLIAIATTGYALWPTPTGATFRAREFVLVGDLENRTNDPLLSRTVQEALTIALQQSQFVNLVSRERVAETLRRMKRPPGSPLDESAAWDLSRREAIPAFMSGSVTRSGDRTQITVKVLEAGGGALLFAESVEYQKPEELFANIDDLARRVRENLGESLDLIQRSSQPLQKVTTGSLEALRQYSEAVAARSMGDLSGVEAPLLAALQLDPEFAMAHMKLGDYYLLVAGDSERAFPHIDRGYGLRSRLTERESHFIAAAYFSAHQQFEDARDSLKALTTLHPDDPEFHFELANAHYALEDLRPAIAELREAIRVNPRAARVQGSLVLFLARANQPAAALDASAEAARIGIDAPNLYWARGLALAGAGDLAGARKDFDKLTTSAGYYRHLGLLQGARLMLLEGRIADGIARLEETVALTQRERDVPLELAARVQLARACLLVGRRDAAKAQAAEVLRLTASPFTRPNALRDAGSLALAVGDADGARACLRRLEGAARNAVREAAHLFLAAELALHEKRYSEARRIAGDSFARRPFHGCSRIRARAAAALGDWDAAAQEWAMLLSARGQVLQDGFVPDLKTAESELANAKAKGQQKGQ